jgi:hypothetical protein
MQRKPAMKNISEEIRAILERGNRKEIAPRLGLSEPRLSQWATGESLITEAHLARIVDSEMPDGAKERELFRLFLLLSQERIEREKDLDKEKPRWTQSSLDLIRRTLAGALDETTSRKQSVKRSGRTLCDFPDSFYPLAIVSGDKREDSESRITVGDFGAVGASHAELRWLCELGLRDDVELYGDKVFVLESVDELKARFGKTHLLVVGSPGSNHLARRCLLAPPKVGWRSAAAPFRFNLPQFYLKEIELFLESLRGLRPKELVGKRAEETTEKNMKHWLRYLFTGGIIDPTNRGFWIRGYQIYDNRDFGLISIARNPFSDPSGEPYMCVMVAGFHLLGTAWALRMLAKPQQNFVRHPFGGVIEVQIDTGLPFAKRFDLSRAEWDDENGYEVDDLRERLIEMKNERFPPTLDITSQEIEESLNFLKTI